MNDPQESVIRTVIASVLEREGGVADVGDGKGITRFGQTPEWLTRWRLPVPQSVDDATMNYRSWLEATNLDALCTEDDLLPDVVIDFAVHAGERVAIAALQRALRVKADGLLGPVTMTALVNADRMHIAACVLADRLDSTFALVTKHPDKYAVYAHGWAARLAAQVRSLA